MAGKLRARLLKAVRHPGRALGFAARKAREALLWDRCYAAVREPKVEGGIAQTPDVQAAVVGELRAAGFTTADLSIDVADYHRYVSVARYDRYLDYCAADIARLPEKTLEHYLAAQLLGLGKDDVYIDVGGSDSPAPEVYRALYQCAAYRQDLSYPAGVHGNRIGGDAGAMPLPDGFATRMAMHCSFEHFEGDADIRFMREAARVLRPGGRLCIVPLYLHDRYAVQTDPCAYRQGSVTFEPDAVLYCARGWGHRHGRNYDVPHLRSRVAENLSGLRMTTYVVRNEKAVHQSCYVKFIGLFVKQ